MAAMAVGIPSRDTVVATADTLSREGTLHNKATGVTGLRRGDTIPSRATGAVTAAAAVLATTSRGRKRAAAWAPRAVLLWVWVLVWSVACC